MFSYRADNPIIDALFWPVRQLIKVFRFLLYCAIFLLMFLWANTAWVVGLGPRGYATRVAELKAVEVDRVSQGASSTILYNFAYAPARQKVGNWEPGIAEAFTPCSSPESLHRHDSWNTADEYLDSSRSYWKRGKEERRWMIRDSAVQQKALILGALNTAALRTEILALKANVPSHLELPTIDGDPASVCGAPADIWGVYLPDVKAIDVRYYHESGHRMTLIYGMCLAGVSCSDKDLHPNPTFYADLLSTTPVLSKGQQAAVDELNSYGTADFWLKEAHALGIRNQDERIISDYMDFERKVILSGM